MEAAEIHAEKEVWKDMNLRGRPRVCVDLSLSAIPVIKGEQIHVVLCRDIMWIRPSMGMLRFVGDVAKSPKAENYPRP